MEPMSIPLPCSTEKLLPHRAPMRFIERLDGITENGAYTGLTLPENHLFAMKNGCFDPLVFVELLAQLTAAHNGYLGLSRGARGHMGYLVGLKHFTVEKRGCAGDLLQLSVKKETQFENVSYVKGMITCRDEMLAQGALKLWEQTGPSAPSHRSGPPAGMTEITETPDRFREWQERSILHKAIIDCIQDIAFQPGRADVMLGLHPDFIGFKGHFPGYPILPGVIMLKIAWVIAEMASKTALTLREIKMAKFAKTILPGAVIKIECRHTVKKSYGHIDTVIMEKGKTCSRMVMITA